MDYLVIDYLPALALIDSKGQWVGGLCGAFQDANCLLHLYQLKGSLAQSRVGETAAYC